MAYGSLLFRFSIVGRFAVCGLILLLFSNSAAAQGVTRSWVGGGATDDWFDAANWSPAAIPNVADILIISTIDIAGLNTNNVVIEEGGRIEIISSTAVVTLSFFVIGDDGEGTLDMSAGTLTTDSATIGNDGDSHGTANITSSFSLWNITDSTSSDLTVGHTGEGWLNITNGADVNVADDGYVGRFVSGTGIVNLDGTLDVQSLTDLRHRLGIRLRLSPRRV